MMPWRSCVPDCYAHHCQRNRLTPGRAHGAARVCTKSERHLGGKPPIFRPYLLAPRHLVREGGEAKGHEAGARNQPLFSLAVPAICALTPPRIPPPPSLCVPSAVYHSPGNATHACVRRLAQVPYEPHYGAIFHIIRARLHACMLLWLASFFRLYYRGPRDEYL